MFCIAKPESLTTFSLFFFTWSSLFGLVILLTSTKTSRSKEKTQQAKSPKKVKTNL